MFPADFLTADRVGRSLEIASKKRLIETLAGLLATGEPGLGPDEVFARLLERERLGSTGLGHGVALPHARMAEVTRSRGALVTISHGIDYDAPDGEPVDLAFAMLVPESATGEHLRLLAELAGRFNDPDLRRGLRTADSVATILHRFGVT